MNSLDISPDVGDSEARFLQEVVAAAGAGVLDRTGTVLDPLRAMVARWHPPVETPLDLVGRPCPIPSPEWHLGKLLELDGPPAPSDDAIDRARRVYHARWLAHLLMPDRVEFRPSVTILIPVYNRAMMAAEAVESCLAQTWRPIEILVIDDGSTDDLAGALFRFGDAVRVIRQPNGGVSSARNAGIRLARGDFIHFLDSDDLLLPKAVSRKIDGFARYPDAELCYSLAEHEGVRSLILAAPKPPDGTADCPTVDMLGRDLHRSFYVPCVMMPRFTMLASGGFEEDLRRGEDTRFWFKLGLRDTKVIGLSANLTIRRLSDTTLSANPLPLSLQAVITARTIADCLRQSRTWPLAARRFLYLMKIMGDAEAESVLSGAPAQEISKLRDAISVLGTSGLHDGRSPMPLLAQCRQATKIALHPERGNEGKSANLLRQLSAAVEAAVQASAPLTRSDVLSWSGARVTRSGNGRLNALLTRAEAVLRADPSTLPLVDELLRHAPSIPRRLAVRRYIKLRRWHLPRRIALWAVLRKSL